MKNKKIYIIFSILIVILCAVCVDKTLENDTFSAIKIGDYIIHNGVDFVEHFNFNDLIYHNARWLFNVMVAFAYNKFNFLGVYLFTIICSISIGLTMFNCLLKKNKNLIVSFVITILALVFTSGCLTARAQIFSYLLLFLEVYFIEKLIKDNKISNVIIITIISVLIANIHTTVWAMTLILFLPYFAEYIISKYLKKPKVLYYDNINIKTLLITFLIVSVSGLLTPLGLLPYTYMIKTLSGDSTTVEIIELNNTNIFTNFNAFVYFVIYVFFFIYLRKKIKISDIFLVFGLLFMTIMASRNLPVLIIVSSISLSRLIMDSLENHKKDVDIIVNYIYKDKLIISLIILFILIISGVYSYRNIYKRPYVDEKMYPIKAADYIIKNIDLDKLRLYNDFNDGAYLEFRGIKVFLDSRSEVYCEEFNDTTILRDWYAVSRIKTDYTGIFAKYKFTHLLLYNDAKLLISISKDSNYKPIYSDEYFVLYEKVE